MIQWRGGRGGGAGGRVGPGASPFVVAPRNPPPVDPRLTGGHLVKARYTPQQVSVRGADEQGSPHHDVLRDADDLFGMPVVVADLHSSLPAGAPPARAARPTARLASVMTAGPA